jgi:hypothetical protein
MATVPFRKFKIPGVTETQFFQSTSTANNDFMLLDLARSGLTPDDLEAYQSPMMKLKEGALAGYGIPYYDLNGEPLTNSKQELIFFRTRLKYPEFSREQRYIQPEREQSARNGLPPFLPYIHPRTLTNEGDILVCCEGEKKTAAVLKYIGVPAFGIGGAQMWRDPAGSGGIHPWIKQLVDKRGIKKILVVPDGDVYRYDICSAYGTFANALVQAGIPVEILNPPGKIDDLIVEWGQDAPSKFANLSRIDPEQLVQSAASLIPRFNLAFKQDAKGNRVMFQHSSNITKLMEEHPAFPVIWRNLDKNTVIVGESPAVPEYTEMLLANYFQHNLSMDKVNKAEVLKVIQYLARKNQKSPFLDYINSLEWDGVRRLETWAIRHWGIPDDPFVREVSRKWLVSAVARMTKPGTKLDWMPIVIGPQGTGKTTMPSIFFKENYLPIYGESSDKDLALLQHSHLCVGFDELDSFGKREASTLKAMITRSEDAFRPPYGAVIETFPRRFTLYGCGNKREFLQHDPSGYRRYAILEVDRILDFAGLERERDQLWAEAKNYYHSGSERYWEVEGASERAQSFVPPNPLEEQIVAWIATELFDKKSTSIKDGVLYFTMTGLMRMALKMEGSDAHNPMKSKDVAGVLHSIGCKQGNTRRMIVPGVSGRHYYISQEAFNLQR